MDYTSIKVGQLPTDEISGGNFIPHEVNGVLKKATFTDLAAFIGATDAVGFRAVSVPNGGTLPTTNTQEFILVGPGTYNNVGGGSTITVTEELNALVSNGTFWFIGVQISIDAPPGNAVWGQIVGTLSNQTDLKALLDVKADLVAGKVPASQLPSYVDDVVEVANFAALPATGETGKIYVTLDSGFIYRWTGTIYVRIADEAPTWGTIVGTLGDQTDLQTALNAKEDEIAPGTTAQYWRGDKSWQTLNKSAVVLGNVDNTSDLDKPISTATQTALNGKFNNPTGDTTQYIAGDGSLISFPIAGQAGTLVREVRNVSGATITKGTVVYINGGNGNRPTIAKALATGDSTSAQTFGLVQSDISNNANGYVVCIGDLIGINTSGISVGSQLYLSSTNAGEYTTTKQLAPSHLVYIGIVTRSHASLGQIEVKIQNGYELDELHDVAIASKANNEVLVYESSSDLWKNKSIPTILGYTPADDSEVVKLTGNQTITGTKTFTNLSKFTNNTGSFAVEIDTTSSDALVVKNNGTTTLQISRSGEILGTKYRVSGGFASQFLKANGDLDSTAYTPASRTITINGVTQDLTANRSFTVATHDAVTIGTANGLSLSGQALSLALASGSTTGALSAADWTTFNNKQNTITNPITGSGTINFLPKFTQSGSIGNSQIFDNGTFIGIGISTGLNRILQVVGSTPISHKQTNSPLEMIIGQFDDSGNAIINNTANAILGFSTNNQRAMTILPNLNVGIGTTSPSALLDVNGTGRFNGTLSTLAGNGLIVGGNSFSLSPSSTRGIFHLVGSTDSILSFGPNGNHNCYIYSASSITQILSIPDLAFVSGGSERMRITSGGDVLVGTTNSSYNSSGRGVVTVSGSVSAIYGLAINGIGKGYLFHGGNHAYLENSVSGGNLYVTSGGANGVYLASGGIAWIANSDERLKTDLIPIENGLNKVCSLRSVIGRYKTDDVDKKRAFLIAQDVEKVLPEAVYKDEDTGNLGVSYSEVIPLLVAAIKELKAEIEILKTK